MEMVMMKNVFHILKKKKLVWKQIKDVIAFLLQTVGLIQRLLSAVSSLWWGAGKLSW